jgi:hypothetical protein
MGEIMSEHEIVESVGIEMEFSNFDRESRRLRGIMQDGELFNYKLKHDASCESFQEFFADTDLPISFENKKDLEILASIVKITKIGGEIVSPIRHSGSKTWIKEIYKLIDIMKTFGEDETSTRDSFHVHVNVTQSIPLVAIQNLLRITLSLEAILFRLGGMGRMNRGQENNYCFCRPFLGNGPPVIKQRWGNNKVSTIPICLADELLQAETKEEFFNRYGDSIYYAQRSVNYVTQRYMCVNFYPILTQGSFEFRTANKTLNPDYIIAWTNLCKAIVDKAFICRDEELYDNVQRPLYENREISRDEFLSALDYYPKLDEDSKLVLTDIWEKSPTPIFDNNWRFSHLREPTTFVQKDYAPKSLGADVNVEQATFVDIHHLERLERRGHEFGHGLLRGNPHFDAAPRVDDRREENNGLNIGPGLRAENNNKIHVDDMYIDWNCIYDQIERFHLCFRREDEGHLVSLKIHDAEMADPVEISFNADWFSVNYIIEQLYDEVPFDEILPN